MGLEPKKPTNRGPTSGSLVMSGSTASLSRTTVRSSTSEQCTSPRVPEPRGTPTKVARPSTS